MRSTRCPAVVSRLVCPRNYMCSTICPRRCGVGGSDYSFDRRAGTDDALGLLQVKIHSLPQEWLWCESWCGNATKSKAKTIDLCNNPMTKEPKLHGARRIVSEWPAYDEEVIGFTSRVEAILGGDDPGNQDEGRPLAPDPAGSVAASELGGHDDTEL